MNSSPRFAFFGTPNFSVRMLEILEEHGLLPELVVTAPDKPRGRGQKLQPTPVKTWALKRDVPVLTPESLNDLEFTKTLKDLTLDCSVVAAYGLIMPKEVLSAPRLGSINVHPSLLPKYRGASPIESQILADEEDIGVSIMLMDEKMDHGPILSQESISRPSLLPDAQELEKALSDLGGELLARTLVAYVAGEIDPKPQNHSKATYTKKFKKEDTLVDFSDDPYHNFLKIRALRRFRPHFFTERNSKKQRVVITRASFDRKNHALIIERVVPEGGSEMDYGDFVGDSEVT